jgi:hypothetical protein
MLLITTHASVCVCHRIEFQIGWELREILNINNTELVSFHLIDYKKKKGNKKTKVTQTAIQ